ncbi:MAG: leucine-rich repeat domain-containing protein, partial [Lachnospiraceae bacterium]|nr:leucine-rich repeat domain-containing protein [Lachnospiraceae bacterium]
PPAWTRSGYVLGWDSDEYKYVQGNTVINAVWMVSLTGGDITEQKAVVGDTRTINYITYLVTRVKTGDNRVQVVGCTKKSLTSVTIPNTVTFGGRSYKVTNIGAGVFRDMPSLAKLSIGKNVIKINKYAFYNCPKLKSIVIHSYVMTTVGERAFKKIYVKAKINVKNTYIKKYKNLLTDAGLSRYATVY